ncbi:MAG: HAD family hydrolase [Erysipelotrichaceae bacterium]|nr:HAD family hydrolase [Erysipelotrichaceae bacterium]MDD3810187.1 HAD family hydrolase [Erysipelotrichaceae bacterium]
MNISKFAFYDFDDTLIHGDSNKYIFLYGLRRRPLFILSVFPIAIYFIGYKLKLCPINKAKSIWLRPLKWMDDKELEDFYKTEIMPHYYDNVVANLKAQYEAGYLVYICSASVEAYLLKTDLPYHFLSGTRTKVRGGRYTNLVIGKNCKRKEKVARIQEVLDGAGLAIDYENSYAYSDSPSDWPMLKLVKNRVRIDKQTGAMSEFK